MYSRRRDVVFIPKLSCGSCVRIFGELLGILLTDLVSWMRILLSLMMFGLGKGVV